jgi:hypothetical protein
MLSVMIVRGIGFIGMPLFPAAMQQAHILALCIWVELCCVNVWSGVYAPPGSQSLRHCSVRGRVL